MADDNKPKTPIETVKQIFNELVTLNIITAVGEVDMPGKDERWRLSIKDGAKVIWTSIDMLQGDITTALHPDFAGDAGKELREFHASREQQAQAIVKNNIEALEKLVSLIDHLSAPAANKQ